MKLAVFIDFDNIQIGVKDTLGKEFDVSVVLEALKERGEVVTKVAYGDWPRAGEHSRQMTQHAVQMVQRNVTPRGDKNGADINLALDALEMAFTRDHINAFAIVGGDSDFIALVEKLKQYDKRVFVVGGRAFTSNILQRNCHEFIAYENLLKTAGGEGPRTARSSRAGRSATEGRPLSAAVPAVQRALKILSDREVEAQLGPLKSTILQLDSTFSERDYGVGSFREFMEKMQRAGYIRLRRIDRGYLVEPPNGEGEKPAAPAEQEFPAASAAEMGAEAEPEAPAPEKATPATIELAGGSAEAMVLLKPALAAAVAKTPNRPLYMRHIRQALRAANKDFDERRYGFRGFLDLLHQGQREGLFHLQRDRRGVWRIFPAGTSAAEPMAPAAVQPESAAGAEFPGEPEISAMSSAAEPIAEAIDEPDLITPEVDWSEPVFGGAEEAAAEEAAPPAEPEISAPRKPPHKRSSRPRRGARKGTSQKRNKPTEGE
jgi:uncharacterized LabA/DUF88 family protein